MNFDIFRNPKTIVKNINNLFEEKYELTTTVKRDCCGYSLINNSDTNMIIKEIKIAEISCDEDMKFYGEGYNMLSQYGGTIGNPSDIGSYSDREHYKMPTEGGKFTVYNLIILHAADEKHLIAFTSCNRFRGEFRISKNLIEIVICIEGIELEPGEKMNLEEIFFGTSNDINTLFFAFGEKVNKNHKMLELKETPVGWCSWYCYGPDITNELMLKNIDAINKNLKGIKYILIDDGYQSHMGDWLVENENLGMTMYDLCKEIKKNNIEPAIWVAPFIADGESDLFKNHPDWFVTDDNGNPLCSKDVTFGGWRFDPWYILDTTNPEAGNYLYDVFSHMKNKYGCKYFKLDANNWGALPFGKRYMKNTTCIEGYRMGMQRILDAVGEEGIILGCNAPMWPSLGLVHCMRVSTDIYRSWSNYKQVAYECFHRVYQNDIFWRNDPDCFVFSDLHLKLFDPASNKTLMDKCLTDNEKYFHLTSLLAVGGLKFLSDRMDELTKDELKILQKVIETDFGKIKFINDDYSVAQSNTDKEKYALFFNNTDDNLTSNISFEGKREFKNYWTDETILAEKYFKTVLEPHSAKAYLVNEIS